MTRKHNLFPREAIRNYMKLSLGGKQIELNVIRFMEYLLFNFLEDLTKNVVNFTNVEGNKTVSINDLFLSLMMENKPLLLKTKEFVRNSPLVHTIDRNKLEPVIEKYEALFQVE